MMVGVCWMVIENFRLPKKGEVHVISFLKKKLIPPMPSWVTEKFQSPFNGGGVSDGD
jgi:hypothetical protein